MVLMVLREIWISRFMEPRFVWDAMKQKSAREKSHALQSTGVLPPQGNTSLQALILCAFGFVKD